jgi:hypothetical protein
MLNIELFAVCLSNYKYFKKPLKIIAESVDNDD